MDDVIIYSGGPLCCSVCAPSDLPLEDVEAAVNDLYPTGISSPWAKSESEFADGSPNPRPCNDDPSRIHYLMDC